MSVSYLGASLRVHNILLRNNLVTIKQVLSLSDRDLMHLPGMGKQSFKELRECLDNWNAKTDEEIECLRRAPVDPEENEKRTKLHLIEFETDIDKLDISIRTYNVLKRLGIRTIAQARGMSDRDLLDTYGFGATCLSDFKTAVARFESDVLLDLEFDIRDDICKPDYEALIRALYLDINKHCKDALSIDDIREVLMEISIFLDDFNSVGAFLNNVDIMDYVYDQQVFKDAIEKLILHLLEQLRGWHKESGITMYLPKSFLCLGRTQEFLQQMVVDNKIEYYHNAYGYPCKHLDECIDEIRQENIRTMVRRRLNGDTLQVIGQDFGVTRERVRQILSKQLYDLSVRQDLFENRYAYWSEQYGFECHQDFFCELFDTKPSTYVYLSLAFHCGHMPIEEMLSDEYITDDMKSKIYKFLSSDMIVEDECVIPKQISDIIEYILKRYHSDDNVNLETVRKEYIDFCDRYDLSKLKTAADSKKGFFNRITKFECKYAISSGSGKVRYYDLDSDRLGRLITSIDFSKYMNCAVSAKKLFENQPDLMAEYNILNEYELHNILRKCGTILPDHIELVRSPIVHVGNVDRDKQVVDLLYKMSPIRQHAFASAFSDLYGIDSKIAISNWFPCIDKYLSHGCYEISKSA